MKSWVLPSIDISYILSYPSVFILFVEVLLHYYGSSKDQAPEEAPSSQEKVQEVYPSPERQIRQSYSKQVNAI